jgi:flagellar hook-length control protein FliK
MGISLEPVLPLPPDRATPRPPADSAGDFEELVREAPPRRADSPPRADAPTDELQAGAPSDAATTAEASTAPAAPEDRLGPESEDASNDQSEKETVDPTLAPAASIAATVPSTDVPPSDVPNPDAAPAGETNHETLAESPRIPPTTEATDPTLAASQPNSNAAILSDETLPSDSPAPDDVPEALSPEVEARAATAARPNQPDGPDNRSEPGRRERRSSTSPAVAAKAAEGHGVDAQATALQQDVEVAAAGNTEPTLETVTNKVPEPTTEHAQVETVPQHDAARSKQTAENNAASPAASSGAEDGSARLSSADRVRFVQRVARAVEAARPDGEIRLRLRPPELGSIHLRVKTEDGVLTAHVETETRQAQSLLAERVPELRERLAEMNIRMERFDVECRSGDEGRSSSFAQQSGAGGERDFGFHPRPASGRDEAVEPSRVETRSAKLHRGDLDVLV